MKRSRSAWIGAGVGLALGMPLFEVFLLTLLAIDAEWFNARVTIQYFSHSGNVIGLLALWHLVTACTGAILGATVYHYRRRRRLRVIPGYSGRSR